MPNSPPTGCNGVRKQAATTAIQKEGKLSWHHKAPRKDHRLTLTLPPPALASRLCSHGVSPDADVKGVFTPGGGKASPRRLQVRTAWLPPPLPLLPVSLKARKLPSPHSFSSHLLCSLLKAPIRQLGRGKGGASLSAGILSAWQYIRHFCVVDYGGSMSLTEVAKPARRGRVKMQTEALLPALYELQ